MLEFNSLIFIIKWIFMALYEIFIKRECFITFRERAWCRRNKNISFVQTKAISWERKSIVFDCNEAVFWYWTRTPLVTLSQHLLTFSSLFTSRQLTISKPVSSSSRESFTSLKSQPWNWFKTNLIILQSRYSFQCSTRRPLKRDLIITFLSKQKVKGFVTFEILPFWKNILQ